MIFPGTVGLSNPISLDRTQRQRSSEAEVKRVSPKEQPGKRAARPQGGLLESVVIAPAVDPTASKVEQVSTSTEIVRDASSSDLISLFVAPRMSRLSDWNVVFFPNASVLIFFFALVLDTGREYRSSSDESLVDNSIDQSIM